MKRLGCRAGVSAVLCVTSFVLLGHAGSPFEQKLPLDRQALHILARLTFGPRPGDVEQVRRLGVDRWIDQQLHPDLVTESAALEPKLKALTTVGMPMWQILAQYQNTPASLALRPPSLNALSMLTPQQSA